MRSPPMLGVGKSPARAVAVVVLLAISAAAVKGRVPVAAGNEPRGVAVLIFVALLGIALVVVAGSIITRIYQRQVAVASATDRAEWLPASPGRRTPRWHAVLLSGLVMIVGFSVLLVRADEASYVGISFLVLLIAASIVTVQSNRRLRPSAQAAETSGHHEHNGWQQLRGPVEMALAEIADPAREPRDAILACHAAMDREVADMLVLDVARNAVGVDSATRLMDLFSEARFSRHAMSEDDREAAAHTLGLILDWLRATP